MNTSILLYGSYGYTGGLIADLAVKKGLKPVLAGRDADRLAVQASSLGLASRAISLEDTPTLEAALAGVSCVLNCAGPFSQTYRPIVEACLRKECHYLDITGEVEVYEALAAMSGQAKEAGVMLLPGVGLDVVPSDCLAAHLKHRLPDATQLALALSPQGGFSRGTYLTTIEGLSKIGLRREDGKLRMQKKRVKTLEIDFGDQRLTVLRIPWGDLSTAYFSTGIPNIETYMAYPKAILGLMRISGPIMGWLGTSLVQGWLKRMVKRLPPGPSERARTHGSVQFWGEVRNDLGKVARSTLITPEGYTITAALALGVVERVLTGNYTPGYQTPSLAYGADFILQFEGCVRKDL